ncbi:isochorismate synthase [Carnobacterium gallinarum]|uniref:isochorismate synthase n=1 Tax=Carnobacterium gallinarum TaxID=2749 RepID=UPI0005577A60|nr:isochorismate synthase [Carnobacterium gallinarum]
MLKLPNELLEEAKEKLKVHSKILISYVIELEEIDAMTLFKKGSSLYQGTRIFWQNPQKTLTMAGIGQTEIFQSENNRQSYQELTQFKRELMIQTVSNHQVLGTGALFVGGFPFDSHVETTSEWQEFKKAYFSLPTYLVTETPTQTFSTFNFYVTESNLIEETQRIFSNWQILINQPIPLEHQSSIVSKTELATEEWLQAVEETVEAIKQDSELKKVVLSRQMLLQHQTKVDTNTVLEKLKATQQNSYFFVLENGEKTFIGATPERLLSVEGNQFYSACVAGSAPRGATPSEDEKIGSALLADHKNVHEHHLVVEMISQTMKQFSENIRLSGAPTLLKNRDIQHLFLTLTGTRKLGIPFLSAVQMMHPTPALGGVPTDLALAIIRQKEPYNRGFYGAPIGWIDAADQGEFAVGIRSALITGSQSLLFAGCGIVADSQPNEELIETGIKFQPMLRALGGMENE